MFHNGEVHLDAGLTNSQIAVGLRDKTWNASAYLSELCGRPLTFPPGFIKLGLELHPQSVPIVHFRGFLKRNDVTGKSDEQPEWGPFDSEQEAQVWALNQARTESRSVLGVRQNAGAVEVEGKVMERQYPAAPEELHLAISMAIAEFKELTGGEVTEIEIRAGAITVSTTLARISHELLAKGRPSWHN